jgi:hypothetical protein
MNCFNPIASPRPTRTALATSVRLTVLLAMFGSLAACRGSEPETVFATGTLETSMPLGPGQCKAIIGNQAESVQDLQIDNEGSYVLKIPHDPEAGAQLTLRIDCFGYEQQSFTVEKGETFQLPPARLKKQRQGSLISIQAECPADSRQIDLEQYRNIARLGPGATPVRIRSSAFFSRNDESNVIGSIDSGSWITAGYWVKNPDLGNALAILAPLQDRNGQTCQGYISISVVEVIPTAFYGYE